MSFSSELCRLLPAAYRRKSRIYSTVFSKERTDPASIYLRVPGALWFRGFILTPWYTVYHIDHGVGALNTFLAIFAGSSLGYTGTSKRAEHRGQSFPSFPFPLPFAKEYFFPFRISSRALGLSVLSNMIILHGPIHGEHQRHPKLIIHIH